MIEINIHPIDLEFQHPTQVKKFSIKLFEKYLIHEFEFFAREPIKKDDLELGWNERVYNFGHTIVMKKNIAALDIYWIDKQRIWGMSIIVSGLSYDLQSYYKKQSQAEENLEIIKQWLIYETQI